jgi:hypothetical protein
MVGNIFRDFLVQEIIIFLVCCCHEPKQKKNQAQFSRSKHRILFISIEWWEGREALQCHLSLEAREYSLDGSQTLDTRTTSALYSMDETICLGDRGLSRILWGNRRVLTPTPPSTNMFRSASRGMTRKYFQKADENRDGHIVCKTS